jgi:dTDP-glucose pyrophosphorylase
MKMPVHPQEVHNSVGALRPRLRSELEMLADIDRALEKGKVETALLLLQSVHDNLGRSLHSSCQAAEEFQAELRR